MKRAIFAVVLSICAVSPAMATGTPEGEADAGSVNVYSHRHYDVDRRLYAEFTERTGIEVNVVRAGADELIERLDREGENTPADVLITVDAGRLNRARDRDLLRPVTSARLEEQVPAHLRDEEGAWYGLTARARVIVYHPDRVSPQELSTYEALAEPRWRDRIAIRSSGNIYNVSLLASLVAHHGEEQAREWAAGVVENFARPPQGNDRDQIKAVAAGVADIAVVNTYYLGLLETSSNEAEQQVAREVEVFFPNQDGRGAHINVSGAGVTRHAPNPENARRLLEFLTGETAQREFADVNYEYPVHPDVEPADRVAAWGDFTADRLPLGALGEYADEAVAVFDDVGWR